MVICITGMHRSGTSLTASWLQECGLTIHDGNIMGPNPSNPKGHFEDRDFVNLHSDSIDSEFPGSFGWKLHSHEFLTFKEKYLNHAKDLLNKRIDKYELWGWKDPRTVNFLNQWKSLIPDLNTLLIWRPFSEVVSSLTKRSRTSTNLNFKISIIESIKLWKNHNRMICKFKTQYPKDTLLISLHNVINKDETVLNILNNTFILNLEYKPIQIVYEKSLPHNDPYRLFIQIIGMLSGCNKIESTLKELSDLNSFENYN